MAAGKEELTFIMVKPDGVHRGLIADIIKRFEQKGYKLVGIKILVPTPVRLSAGCCSSAGMQ
jgi:nucleoside-diphosphate kinase